MFAVRTLIEPRHTPLLRGLEEALSFVPSGEVAVRSGTRSGRIFVAAGRIAWVTVSGLRQTLGDRLRTLGVAPTELANVFDDCRQTGKNFAETIVEWQLLDREVLRSALLEHVTSSFREILTWEPLHALVLPSDRKYQGSLTFSLPELLGTANERDEDSPLQSPQPTPPPPSGITPVDERVAGLSKETQMNIETLLTDLKDIKGYKASGIMNYTGEMLAADSADPSIDLNLVGASFNDIFRSAHAVCEKIGLDACTENLIQTPKGIVLMRCSGVHSKVHVHLISILAVDGNHALTRMALEKITKKAMDALA